MNGLCRLCDAACRCLLHADLDCDEQKPTIWHGKQSQPASQPSTLVSARVRHDLLRHSLPRPYLIQLPFQGETRANASEPKSHEATSIRVGARSRNSSLPVHRSITLRLAYVCSGYWAIDIASRRPSADFCPSLNRLSSHRQPGRTRSAIALDIERHHELSALFSVTLSIETVSTPEPLQDNNAASCIALLAPRQLVAVNGQQDGHRWSVAAVEGDSGSAQHFRVQGADVSTM